MKKLLLFASFLIVNLFAGEYEDAMQMLNNGQMQQTVTKLEKLSQNGNEQAKIMLATLYVLPGNAKEYILQGIRYAEELVNVGNTKALLLIGNGYSALGKTQEALKIYQNATKLEAPIASRAWQHIGDIYLIKLKNFNKAINAYQKAIALDHSNIMAFNGLGNIFFYFKNDYKKALHYYQKAYQLGDKDLAAYHIGGIYMQGLSVKQSYKKAAKYFQESAQQGNEASINKLALLYAQGYGVKLDKIKAYQLWSQAARSGNPSVQEEAQKNLDILCTNSPWACRQ